MKNPVKFPKSVNFTCAAFLLSATIACQSSANTNVSINAVNSTANANVNNVGAAMPSSNLTESNTQAQQISPDALVADLYKQHDAQKGPFFQTKNRALLDKYFTKSLADMIWKDVTTTPQGEVGALDFDPLYNAQDVQIKNLKVGQATVANDTAKVPVTFLNYTTKETVNFALVKENGSWKINDILYGDFTLTSVYKENEKAENSADKTDSADKNFEGKYQVGETTCTVTPIKMAFEVKWAKGTGTEIFFFQDRANDKIIFASDPKTGKANSFAFDDENYNTGTFYRADGKQFPIKRIN